MCHLRIRHCHIPPPAPHTTKYVCSIVKVMTGQVEKRQSNKKSISQTAEVITHRTIMKVGKSKVNSKTRKEKKVENLLINANEIRM